jgi:L-ascorbate metabolism protein UlaG (beta-lactamase superfamily)
MGLSITWLGHSTFLLELPTGDRILFDPWLGNPKCPDGFSRPDALGKVDVILVSHGHDDHAADVVPVARATGAAVICIAELDQHLTGRGLRNVRGMNIGGTQMVGGLRVTMTPATHSSSAAASGSILYLGSAAGFVLRADRLPTIYFAGDTAKRVCSAT